MRIDIGESYLVEWPESETGELAVTVLDYVKTGVVLVRPAGRKDAKRFDITTGAFLRPAARQQR